MVLYVKKRKKKEDPCLSSFPFSVHKQFPGITSDIPPKRDQNPTRVHFPYRNFQHLLWFWHAKTMGYCRLQHRHIFEEYIAPNYICQYIALFPLHWISAVSFAVLSHMQEQVRASRVEKTKTFLPERQGIIYFTI